MDSLIAPHGGELILNRASEAECVEWQVGAKVRPMLQVGEIPLREFSRPEVARVLIEAMYQPTSSPASRSASLCRYIRE